jgi:hypothetical protein
MQPMLYKSLLYIGYKVTDSTSRFSSSLGMGQGDGDKVSCLVVGGNSQERLVRSVVELSVLTVKYHNH